MRLWAALLWLMTGAALAAPSFNEPFNVNSTNLAVDYPNYFWHTYDSGGQVTNGQLRFPATNGWWFVNDSQRSPDTYPFAGNSTVSVDLALETFASSAEAPQLLSLVCQGLDLSGWYNAGIYYRQGQGPVIFYVDLPAGRVSVNTGFNPPAAGKLDHLDVTGDGVGHFVATLTDTNTGAACSISFTNLLLRSFYTGIEYSPGTPAQPKIATIDNWKIVPGPDPVIPPEWRPTFGPSDEELVGPFSSWLNAKTDFGAIGNGTADDTAALQNALNALSDLYPAQKTGKTVLYLPAGTYRITNRLRLTRGMQVAVIGEHPTNTIVKWAGPGVGDETTPLALLWLDGVQRSRVGRITWDGSGSNVVGVATVYGRTTGGYQGVANTYADNVFTNLGVGLLFGRSDGENGYGTGDDTMNIVRCRFVRCWRGIYTGNQNAFDNYIWDSVFEDNEGGVEDGLGGAHVFRCFFRNSSVADFISRCEFWHTLYGNTSVGSKQFYMNVGRPNSSLLQDNRVFDARDLAAIRLTPACGGTLMMDSQIRSLPGTVGPAVSGGQAGLSVPGWDFCSISNQFSTTNAYDMRSTRWWTHADQVAAYSAMASNMPIMPGTPVVNTARAVTNVATNATSAEIQGAINWAATQTRSMVHIPAGTYLIAQTLTIPANADILFTGDYGGGTKLRWTGTGAGPVLRLQGPSKATIGELAFNGGNGGAGAVYMDNPDQPGARIHADAGFWTPARYGLLVNGCTNAAVESRVMSSYVGYGGLGSLINDASRVVKVRGGGGGGTGYTAVFGSDVGIGAAAAAQFEVTDGGRLLLASHYAECSRPIIKLSGSNTFTYANGRNVTFSDAPSVELDGFSGQATFLAGQFIWMHSGAEHPIVRVANEPSSMRALFLGMDLLDWTDGSTNGFYRAGTGGTLSFLNSRAGGVPLADQGAARSDSFIANMLAQVRKEKPTYPSAQKTINDGITDVGLNNVIIDSVFTGIRVGSTEPPSVAITDPTNGAAFNAPADLPVTALAFDMDGVVTQVVFTATGGWFTATGVLPGTGTEAPYSWRTWLAGGSYILQAVAYDNEGTCSTSAPVRVTVTGSAMLISLASPADGMQYWGVPFSLPLQAQAADYDGTLTQVTFRANGAVVGVDTASPYEYAWTVGATGVYTLTAVAADNRGVSVTSTPVTITVWAAGATDSYWNAGGGANRDWSTPVNWSPGEPWPGGNAWIGHSSYAANATGVVSKTWERCANLYIGAYAGDRGTLAITNGDLAVGGMFNVGYAGYGCVTQAAGTVTMSAAGALNLAAQAGSTGLYCQAGGFLTNANLTVGAAGAGTFRQSGGTNTPCEFKVGNASGSAGVYELSGGLLAPSAGYINIAANGSGGTGTVRQTGGIFDYPAYMNIGYSGAGAYELSGGLLRSASRTWFLGNGNGRGLFTQTGGTNQAGLTGYFTTIGNSGQGIYNMGGGLFDARFLAVGMESGANGALNVTGGVVRSRFFEVGYGAGATGVVTQTGGEMGYGVTVSGLDASSTIGDGGAGIYTLAGGILDCGSDNLVIGNGNGGDGILNLGTNGSSAIWSNVYTIVIRNHDGARGLLRGWGVVGPWGGGSLGVKNSGRVVADGYGTDRTLDLSSFPVVTKGGFTYTSTNGWFAQNHGRLLLPALGFSDSGSACWGDVVTNQKLVNSVKFEYTGGSGALTGALLATDHGAFAGGLPAPIGVWDFTNAVFTTCALTLRYDDILAGNLGVQESNLRVYQRVGGAWSNITFGAVNTGAKTIAALARSPISQIVVAELAVPVFYVSTNGTDGGAGTAWNTAWRTLGYACTHVEDGDTIIVSNGTYAITAQIAITNAITLTSANGADVTLIDAQNSNDVRCIYLDNPGAVVRGFTLTRGKHSNSGAGAFLNNGGTVEWCTIRDCAGQNNGGAVLMNGGLVRNCIIRNNLFGNWDGTVLMQTGSPILRNCLIVNNNYRWGGGVSFYTAGARVENCTIVGNEGALDTGGIRGYAAATVVNSIVYFNIDPDNIGVNIYGSSNYSSCSSDPQPSGTDNITGDPLLYNRAGGDYRLLPGSPCTNAGTTNLTWLADEPNAVDLAGNPRVVDGGISLGCYQYIVGPLDCSFVGTPLSGISPLQTVFTAYIAGTNTTGVTYAWDFDNNGSVDGTGAVATNVYTSAGTYSVSLLVSNAAGEVDAYVRSNYVQVAPGFCYVSTNGSATYPYDSWAKAASTVQAAVDAGVNGTVVTVSNGTYISSSTISITKGVTVRSVNGRAATTLKVSNNGTVRTIYISHANAVVDGFTLSRDTSKPRSGGVEMHLNGLLKNCDVVNGAWDHGVGGNLWMDGGTVSNCMFAWGEDRHVGGIYLAGGSAQVVNSVIVSNFCSSYEYEGTANGVRVDAGCTLRNCLVANNVGTARDGGVCLYGAGTVESCTVASNAVSSALTDAVGGIRSRSGLIRNCVVADNANTGGGANTNWIWLAGTIEYTCTTPDASAHGSGNVSGTPVFENAAAGNYRLKNGSPGVDQGTNVAWMTGVFDLAGNARLQGPNVDMGAYETTFKPSGTLLFVR